MQVNTRYNYHNKGMKHIHEFHSNEPSMTMQGQALSVQEIIAKHIRGESIDQYYVPMPKQGGDALHSGVNVVELESVIEKARADYKQYQKSRAERENAEKVEQGQTDSVETK